MVHREGEGRWADYLTAVHYPWLGTQLVNGCQSHVVHQQHGDACYVRRILLPVSRSVA